MPVHAFDLVLAAALVFVAGFLLASRDFVRGTVLFIAFGLLMALTWVRLLAPDIALAEAAIGAGVTGVLLIDALRQLEWGGAVSRTSPLPDSTRLWIERIGPALAACALLAVLVVAVHQLPGEAAGLATRVQAEMTDVDHPVTAVLLVFRGFDTMLELGILLLAVLGMLAVRGRSGLRAVVSAPPHDAVMHAIVRILVPLAVMVGGFTVWLGTFAPGGAFQSGVILGAAGILLWLSRHRSLDATPAWLWHTLVALGFGAFLLFAGGTLFLPGHSLEYPPGHRSWLIQTIEVAAAVSIGASFTALFVGMHPAGAASDDPRRA